MARLGWNSVAGQTYRVQYADGLENPVWHDLTSDIVATNSTVSVADPGATAPQRFYRLMVVPPAP